MKYALVFDLGTGSVKASLFDANADIVSSVVVNYKTYYDDGGIREQCPTDWWNSICEAVPELLKDFFRYYIAQGKYFQALKPLLRLSGLFPNSRGKYLEQIRCEKFNSEDKVFTFLSQEFSDDGLTMPNLEEAVLFSLDGEPQRFFRSLPFGCHAWMKESSVFWKKYIPVLSEKELC